MHFSALFVKMKLTVPYRFNFGGWNNFEQTKIELHARIDYSTIISKTRKRVSFYANSIAYMFHGPSGGEDITLRIRQLDVSQPWPYASTSYTQPCAMVRPAHTHPCAMVRPAHPHPCATTHQPQLTNRSSATATQQPQLRNHPLKGTSFGFSSAYHHCVFASLREINDY